MKGGGQRENMGLNPVKERIPRLDLSYKAPRKKERTM